MSLPVGSDYVEQALRSIARRAKLTPTLELRLVEIADGASYRQIAERHTLSVHTIKAEAHNLLVSLGISCRHEIEDAARAARRKADAGATQEQISNFFMTRFE